MLQEVAVEATMRELERLGTAQNRKIYRRHGSGENVFGVSFADLGKLKKQIGTDQELAEGLWRTGNADACALATMVADPAAFRSRDLDRWVRDVSYYLLVDVFTKHVVAKTPYARARADRWSVSPKEWIGRAGWDTVAQLALGDEELEDAYFERKLERLESSIHTAPNRQRDAMNSALIAIGGRNARLREKATAAAERIGKVEVDHGDTWCKTPLAGPYIDKIWARRAA